MPGAIYAWDCPRHSGWYAEPVGFGLRRIGRGIPTVPWIIALRQEERTIPTYDLIVIGSGPAGEKGAAQAAYFGKRVALVEAQPWLGGAATNTGTLPSKTLRESALYLSGLEQRGLFGVDYSLEGSITVERFMFRKERVVASELGRISRNLERHRIDLICGRAELLDAHSVRARRPDGTEEVLEAGFILIATGSYPHHPPEIPFDGRRVCDSDQILALDHIPPSMAIIGAGVIGSEYACIFAALGVDVTLIDGRPTLLPFLDRQIRDLLRQRMEELGIRMLLGEEPVGADAAGSLVEVRLRSGERVTCDTLLFAAGRRGCSDGLGLERLGIECDRRGHIRVDEHFQTSVAGVYAAGDVVGFPALASTSMEQGRLAVCHAFDLRYKTRLAPILPYGLYTIPEVSCAGATEEGLRERGIDYQVGLAAYEGNARGQIIGDLQGLVKLIFRPADRRLLGVHIIGESATELIHVGTTCMQFEGAIDAFIDAVYNYPTLSEAYKYAAYDGLGRLARGG